MNAEEIYTSIGVALIYYHEKTSLKRTIPVIFMTEKNSSQGYLGSLLKEETSLLHPTNLRDKQININEMMGKNTICN